MEQVKPITIVTEVAKAYGITTDMLMSRSRLARVSDARAVVSYLLYHNMRMTMAEVGAYIRRDHSTVTCQIRKVESFLLYPTMYAVDISIIKNIENKYFKKQDDETEEMDRVGG